MPGLLKRGPGRGAVLHPGAGRRRRWEPGVGGGDRGPGGQSRGASGGRRGPGPHLVELILSRDPQFRVDGALQRLDDPVEVHRTGQGLHSPRAVGQTAALVFL